MKKYLINRSRHQQGEYKTKHSIYRELVASKGLIRLAKYCDYFVIFCLLIFLSLILVPNTGMGARFGLMTILFVLLYYPLYYFIMYKNKLGRPSLYLLGLIYVSTQTHQSIGTNLRTKSALPEFSLRRKYRPGHFFWQFEKSELNQDIIMEEHNVVIMSKKAYKMFCDDYQNRFPLQ